MKIVVLDGYALNPGDLDWTALEQLGDVTVYDRTAVEQVVDRAIDADVVLTNKVPLSGDVIEGLVNLKYIGVMATGYNIIDMDSARVRDVVVTNVPGYSTPSVVQLTFSLLMELCYRVQRHSDAVMAGRWAASPDFCFWDYPLIELSGKKLGIVGFGAIGQGVADVAEAFGMEVLAYSRTRTDQSKRRNFKWVDLAELLEQSDVVSLHCPQTLQTENMINKESLHKMKKSAMLINTSRGGLIDAQALADALNTDVIAAAGLDVLRKEPPEKDNPLFMAKNCLITPHIAWATKESRVRCMQTVIDNVRAFSTGAPVNKV